MSLPTREELLQRFPRVDDPEILARRKHIIRVLLEQSPETKQELIEEEVEKGIEKGRLSEARAALRRVLVRRQLTPSEDDDARIEACIDLATLERWLDRAITAVSASDALR